LFCGYCTSENTCGSYYVGENQSCCESKGKKFCSATNDHSSACIETTECCNKDKPSNCTSRTCECINGAWKIKEDYKECKDGSIIRKNNCCSGEEPTEHDSVCYSCNSDTGEYFFDYENSYSVCGCLGNGIYNSFTNQCCLGANPYNSTLDSYEMASSEGGAMNCLCTEKSEGEMFFLKSSEYASHWSDVCGVCDGKGSYKTYYSNYYRSFDVEGSKHIPDSHWEREGAAECCSRLGGELCSGDDETICILDSDYKCCKSSFCYDNNCNYTSVYISKEC
jgi:hypothetical protein